MVLLGSVPYTVAMTTTLKQIEYGSYKKDITVLSKITFYLPQNLGIQILNAETYGQLMTASRSQSPGTSPTASHNFDGNPRPGGPLPKSRPTKAPDSL